jgi:radical SAM protein with 4Fe4S-binding SPASM domain
MSKHLNESGIYLIPQFFGSMIYSAQTSRYYPFDHQATTFFQFLKDHTLYEFLEANEPTNQDNRFVDSIRAFYDHFYVLGFFTFDHYFAGECLEISPLENHLTGPLTVHLEVSNTCNLSCKHCFAYNSISSKIENSLTLSEIEVLFQSLRALGSFRVGLTGGEPLLRADLFEIINLAHKYELSPCLTTNGLLITEEIARKLKRSQLKWLNVSFEGSTREQHEFIRGENTFDPLLARVALLKKNNVRFSLAFTIDSNNFHQTQECVKLARCVGAEAAVFRPLYPVGEALNHPELIPTFSQYQQALNNLDSMERGVTVPANHIVELNMDYLWKPEKRIPYQSNVVTNFGCGAGNLVCSISSTGDVSPCSFLGAEYIAGNIREKPFEEIWNGSAVFQSFRNLPGNSKCDTCKFYITCGGGCRARALSFTHELNAPDPWCVRDLQVNDEVYGN